MQVKFLIQTYLYFMDYDGKVEERLYGNELLSRLETIIANEWAEVNRIISLAPQYLWQHYEDTGMQGQPEQEMLSGARKRLKSAIREALGTCRALCPPRKRDRKSQRPAGDAAGNPNESGNGGSRNIAGS